MLIDFHTHIFPDKIAAPALHTLVTDALRNTGNTVTPHTDGTLGGLKRAMKSAGVDISVVLPIATKPSQTDSINSFAQSIRGEEVESFATLHPEQDNWREVLTDIAERGFIGVKLHPEYQQFYVDSKRSLEILGYADKLGLYVTLHAGNDIGILPPVHCTPQRLRNALEYVSGERIIAAHLGAFCDWDNVEKYLVGTPVYFDTAFICDFISPDQYKRIIRDHGADKILFGTDSPWDTAEKEYSFLNSLDIDDEEKDKIFYANALKILKR